MYEINRENFHEMDRFGTGGRQVGQFHWPHVVSVDSEGNVYTGEVDSAGRVQKFIRYGPIGCSGTGIEQVGTIQVAGGRLTGWRPDGARRSRRALSAIVVNADSYSGPVFLEALDPRLRHSGSSDVNFPERSHSLQYVQRRIVDRGVIQPEGFQRWKGR